MGDNKGMKIKKQIKKHLNKMCAICGNQIKVILYSDKTYRNAHYFGKIPLHIKQEVQKALKAGTIKKQMGGLVVGVLKKSPRAYKYEEYWECSKCYWGR